MDTNNLNTLIIIVINGSLILLSFLNFINPLKVNKRANFWLGVSFLLWSTFWIEEITSIANIIEINNYFIIFIRFIQFFTPLVFYLSVIYFTNPDYKFQRSDIKHTLLTLLYLIVLLMQFFNFNIDQRIFQFLLIGLILYQSIFYVVKSYIEIRKHQKKVLLFSSDIEEIDLNWLEHIIILMFLVVIIVILYNILFYTTNLNIFINLAFLIIIYFIAYYSLKQREIYPLDEKQRSELITINQDESLAGIKRKIITDEEMIVIKNKLSEIMLSQKPYLDSELNLIKLANLLSITPHQLSYVINTGFNENFFQFINSYRVDKAKELLLNRKMDKLTILGIAFESGFNSKTSFNTTFKKITNQTPSEFKKTGLIL